jgi:hypothetical protein
MIFILFSSLSSYINISILFYCLYYIPPHGGST